MKLFPWNDKPLLNAEDQEKVVSAIRNAESNTTGELRVFVEKHCSYVNPIDRAWELFAQLGMMETERRNAVLVYVALKDHQFAIVGDKEIYERAGGPLFWETAAAELKTYLKNNQPGDGLKVCVDTLGRALAQHFPYDPAVTRNELPDEIVFGK